MGLNQNLLTNLARAFGGVIYIITHAHANQNIYKLVLPSSQMKQSRKQKVNRLLATIKAQKEEGIDVEKIIGILSFQEGAQRRTCLEYLNTLEINDLIIKKDGKYYPTEKAFADA